MITFYLSAYSRNRILILTPSAHTIITKVNTKSERETQCILNRKYKLHSLLIIFSYIYNCTSEMTNEEELEAMLCQALKSLLTLHQCIFIKHLLCAMPGSCLWRRVPNTAHLPLTVQKSPLESAKVPLQLPFFL